MRRKAWIAKRHAADTVYRQKKIAYNVIARRVRDEAQRDKRFAEGTVFRQRHA